MEGKHEVKNTHNQTVARQNAADFNPTIMPGVLAENVLETIRRSWDVYLFADLKVLAVQLGIPVPSLKKQTDPVTGGWAGLDCSYLFNGANFHELILICRLVYKCFKLKYFCYSWSTGRINTNGRIFSNALCKYWNYAFSGGSRSTPVGDFASDSPGNVAPGISNGITEQHGSTRCWIARRCEITRPK